MTSTPSLQLVITLALTVLAHGMGHATEPTAIKISADAPGTPVHRTLHGLFFEDINYGADGGLYAELVQNRSFEHADALYSWSEVQPHGQGRMLVHTEAPLNANNPHFLRLQLPAGPDAELGVANRGYDGIAVRDGESYRFSAHVRVRAGETATLTVQLQDASGKVLATQTLTARPSHWQKLESVLAPNATTSNAKLLVLARGAAVVDLDMISLFPVKTFKNRPNGLRADLAQALADMKPGFMRFPGGCIVEGRDFANMYRWKDTIGDVAERKQNWNLWQGGNSPQYHQTYGLGFFEYFQFCEDIGAEPVPVVNCGMCCQARRGQHVPLDELAPFVQDALDLIEFANGPASSQWGAKRAAMGHPAPFNLKYLAVGNEQWQQEYFDRYVIFQKAIKQKHPNLRIISSSGPAPSDGLWKFAWDQFKAGVPAEVVDEHYYVPPRWLLENVDRYNQQDRKGPTIFVGEYAAHDGRARRNNLRSALAEAAYITGLWRNGDIVEMSSYAPLLAKFGHDQWHPNLIWFDNSKLVLTPSYHVQALASQHRPDVVLPIKFATTGQIEAHPAGMIGVGTWNTQAEYKDIRVTAADGSVLYASDFANGFQDWKTAGGKWSIEDGALRQSSNGEDIRAVVGDRSWRDYTVTLKARKLGGEEGFLVLFQTPDIDNPIWWNLGGWRNTEHSLQGDGILESRVRGSINTNRWYDIHIETKDGVRAYLDGKLIHEGQRKSVQSLYAAAGLDKKAKEIVLTVVNPGNTAQVADVKLEGITVSGKARGHILSGDPAAENSLQSPAHIAPRPLEIRMTGSRLQANLPANSALWLRLPAR
jgi:alpha-L-arabinofuranosidase